MKVLVLMGSPRRRGNTAELCKPFMAELEANGAAVRYVVLADRNIQPCKGCYACQNVAGTYGCYQMDEMPVEEILWADLIVLATPIYAWYCAALWLQQVLRQCRGIPLGRQACGDSCHPWL